MKQDNFAKNKEKGKIDLLKSIDNEHMKIEHKLAKKEYRTIENFENLF